MKNWIYYVFTTFVSFCIFLNCSSSSTDSTIQVPIVTTNDISQITPVSALCGGNITSNGGAVVTDRGVCWSLDTNPTITDSSTSDSSGTGNFISEITGLDFDTTYYVRAYASNSAGTGYGTIKSFKTYQGMADIDGNIYRVVTIGTQTWMAENLKVLHYNNGDPILNKTSDGDWANDIVGAYCEYDNNNDNANTYGRIYNKYATTENIAPTGWHIPSREEWETLIGYLGGSSIAGGKMKEAGTTHWNTPNIGATNESEFTALAAGFRHYNGSFSSMGNHARFWSSTIIVLIGAPVVYVNVELNNSNSSTVLNSNLGENGYSIRCIKD